MAHRSGHNEKSTAQSDLLAAFADEYSDLVALGKRVGPDALNALLEIYGGQKPHIPKPESFWHSLEIEVRDERIRAQFRGNNFEQLALEYDLSERHLRNIVAGARYVRPPANNPPRSLKLSEARFAQVANLATRHHVTLRTMCETLMAVVLALPDLPQRVTAVLGQLDLFEPKETDRTTDEPQTVTAHA